MKNKKIVGIGLCILLLAALLTGGIFALQNETVAAEMTKEEAQDFVNRAADAIASSKAMALVAEKNSITVNAVSYGEEKDILLDCTVSTVDVHSALSPMYDAFLSADEFKPGTKMFKSSLNFKLEFEPLLAELLETAPEKTVPCTISLYDTRDGIVLHANDEVVNAVFGGLADIRKDILPKTSATVQNPDGTVTEKQFSSENIKKGFLECLEVTQNAKPDTSSPLGSFWRGLKNDFNRNFLEAGRWKTIFTGLWVTLKLTIFALLLGIVIGFIVAFIRSTYLKTTKHSLLLKVLDGIARVYLTVIRGTPVVVQIMIIYFVIFMPLGIDKFLAAVICFGLNSGAYVAEIVRGGIMSIDQGQTEAGRSLGFGYMPTMFYIVFPQAFKAVLPALANEFVVLLKETSIAFYIGLGDLMYAGNAIRAATYSAFMPLIAVAIIYLIMVLALQHLVTLLERRLRSSER